MNFKWINVNLSLCLASDLIKESLTLKEYCLFLISGMAALVLKVFMLICTIFIFGTISEDALNYDHLQVISIVKISNFYFSTEDFILISLSRTDDKIQDLLVKYFNENAQFSLMVMHARNNVKTKAYQYMTAHRVTPQYYIFIINHKYEIQEHITQFFLFYKNVILYNVTGLYIIVMPQNLLNDLKTVGQTLSEMLIFNVVIIIPLANGSIDFYSWYPYQYKHQCGQFEEMLKIGHLNNADSDIEGLNLFPPKVPKKFLNCPLYLVMPITIANMTSLPIYLLQDSLFLEMVCSQLQVIVPYSKSNFVDAVGGGLVMQHMDPDAFYEITYPYTSTDLKWFVPCAKPNLRQGHISEVFEWTVWMLIFLTLFTSLIVIRFLLRSDLGLIESYSSIFLNCWAALMSTAMPWMPLSIRMRLYMILWILYALALSTIFQAFFTLFLVVPGYQKSIVTIEEMIESGINYGIFFHKFKAWCQTSDYAMNVCSNANKQCFSELECIEFAIRSGDFAFLSTDLDNDIISSLLSIKHKFCSIEFNTTHLLLTTAVSKFSVFKKPINDIAYSFAQSGLFNLYIKEFMLALRGIKSNKFHFLERISENQQFFGHFNSTVISLRQVIHSNVLANTEENYFSLQLPHFFEPIIFLMLGYCFSTVIFITEVYHQHIYSKVMRIMKYT